MIADCCCQSVVIAKFGITGVPITVGGSSFFTKTAVRPINWITDVIQPPGFWPRLINSPCYAHQSDANCFNAFAKQTGGPANGDLLGFNTSEKWVIVCPASSWDFSPANPYQPVKALKIAECVLGIGGVFDVPPCDIVGHSPYDDLIAGEDAWNILDGSFPSGDSSFWKRASWASATNDRIFGWSSIAGSGVEKFRVWSVAYNGSDFREEFLIEGDNDTPTPATFNQLPNGNIYCLSVGEGGMSKTRFYSNGSHFATMDDQWFGAAAQIEGQVLALVGDARALTPGATSLVIVEDGADPDDQKVFFNGNICDQSVALKPYGISYDPFQQAVVVVWGAIGPTLGAPLVPNFITYIRKALVPGNILGQDGVRLFAAIAVGQGVGCQGSSDVWNVVIPGPLPRPLTVSEAGIEPPAPVPTGDCANLDGCDLTGTQIRGALAGFLNSFANEVDSVCGTQSIRYLWANMNSSYVMTYQASIDGPCSDSLTLGPGGMAFKIALGREDVSDYTDPGVLVRYPVGCAGAPEFHRELYVYVVWFVLACVDGKLEITKVAFATQEFLGRDGTDWPPTTAVRQSCIVYDRNSDSDPCQQRPPVGEACQLFPEGSWIADEFAYTVSGVPGTFWAYATAA